VLESETESAERTGILEAARSYKQTWLSSCSN